MKETKMKIIEPITIEWRCPHCKGLNYEKMFVAPGRRRLKCIWCKETCIGSSIGSR